jgi:hypothetical protein
MPRRSLVLTEDWEANWIRQHPDYYDSKGHSEAVILNIEKRKRMVELEQEIKMYKERLGL